MAMRNQEIPHPLWSFFQERKITQVKLAEVLKTAQPTVSLWMNGKVKPMAPYEERLQELAGKILSWEQRTGRRFNDDIFL